MAGTPVQYALEVRRRGTYFRFAVCRLLETAGVEPDPVSPDKMGIILPGQSK